MKRTELLRHLHEQGCVFIREGGESLMVEQPATEPTFVGPPPRRDQRQARSEDLQGSRNLFHKISTEPVAPAGG